jgi:hypothetical protein
MISIIATSSFAQEMYTSDFIYPEIKVTTTPEYPGFCNPSIGVSITCNEDYDSYLWEYLDDNTVPTITTKTAIIRNAGKWSLTVEGKIDDKLCSKTIEFEVYNLKDSDDIREYFEAAGFYAIEIWRKNLPAAKGGDDDANRGSCSYELMAFRENDSENSIQAEAEMEDLLNSFKPLKGLTNKTKIATTDACLCNQTVEDLEADFNDADAAIWGHQYFQYNTDYKGIWYLKGQILSDKSLPTAEQKEYLDDIYLEILGGQTGVDYIYEQARVFLSNIFMANAMGGFDLSGACTLPEVDDDSYFLSPPVVPIKMPDGADNLIFSNFDDKDDILDGALLLFRKNNKYYRSYSYDANTKFMGFYQSINAQFYESFESPPDLNKYSKINIPYTCNGNCFIANTDLHFQDLVYTTTCSGFDLPSHNQSIDEAKKLITFKETKEILLDIFCQVKHGGTLYSDLPLKFLGKTILAKDVYLGAVKYDYIGLTIPNNPSVLDISMPQYHFNSFYEDFENAIIFNQNDKMRITCFDDNKTKGCKNKTQAYYSFNNAVHNFTDIKPNTPIDNEPSKNEELYSYLTNEENTDNILLFVNGYRPDLGLNLPLEFPNTKNIVSNCNDFHSDTNDDEQYWGDVGNSFINRIGTKNIVYADGHYEVASSNHKSNISFINSFFSCSQGDNPISCLYCDLNKTPNSEGFNNRYEEGEKAGKNLWLQIQQGDIKVKMANGKITGKIDIVAHSMGYAYARGMIDKLKELKVLADGNTFGHFYVLAPENASSGPAIVLDDFEKPEGSTFNYVWQYGSNEKEDPECKQDGVAPQASMVDLPGLQRIFFPNEVTIDGEKKDIRNFKASHSVSNYFWIFDQDEIEINEPGYVVPRN